MSWELESGPGSWENIYIPKSALAQKKTRGQRAEGRGGVFFLGFDGVVRGDQDLMAKGPEVGVER